MRLPPRRHYARAAPFATTFIIGATSDYTLADQTTCTLSGKYRTVARARPDDAASYALLVISTGEAIVSEPNAHDRGRGYAGIREHVPRGDR